jgi:hypothetical protein
VTLGWMPGADYDPGMAGGERASVAATLTALRAGGTGLALCLVGWAVSSAERRTASSWAWPASGLLLLVAVAYGWWGEPRRQARARAALAAADPGPGGP